MPYSQMVALGSSFAAGPSLQPVVDRAARRSGRNYAHLVASRLGASLIDASVSGATTQTILEKRQRVRLRVFAPQIESVHAETDLVTVTAGGNDLGYLSAVLLAALLGQLGRWRLTRPLAARIRSRRVLRPVTPEQKEAATEGGQRPSAQGHRIVVPSDAGGHGGGGGRDPGAPRHRSRSCAVSTGVVVTSRWSLRPSISCWPDQASPARAVVSVVR